MTTKTQIRRTVTDMTVFVRVPDWWPSRYSSNQVEIQRTIRRLLAEAKTVLRGVSFIEALPGYDARELDEALAAMVTYGVLYREGDFYRLAI
jgi:hypothetical protein